MTTGRVKTIEQIRSADPEVNRAQAKLKATLDPILQNPVLSATDWRFNESAAGGSTPKQLLIQYRTGTTWTTLIGLSLTTALVTGDMLVASAAATLSRVAAGTAGQVWTANGAGVLPSWQASSAAVRRVPIDANDVLAYTLDESVVPLLNTGSAGAAGDLDTQNVPNPATLGRVGFFSSALWCTGAANSQGVTGSLSTTINTAFPITLSAWFNPRIHGINLFYKSYRPLGSWAAPFLSIGIGTDASGFPTAQFSTGGALQTMSASGYDIAALNLWHHLGMTYDGADWIIYLDGQKVVSRAQVGAIDYSLSGRWAVSTSQDNAAAWAGYVDDARVANIVRGAAYFANVWRSGMNLS